MYVIHRGTVSELAGELTYNRQWNKQATVTDFIDSDSGIDLRQTSIVQFWHAEQRGRAQII